MADTTTQAPTNTYKLSYSGPEVNERLGRLGDTLVKTGDTAYDLKVEGTMTNDTDAVNVAWVNRLLNQNYLSLKGTSNSAPVLGPISTKGAIYDFPTEHRAVFTHDFLTLGGYRVLTAAGAAEESGAPGEEWKNDKTEFNLVYVDNSQLEQLDGGKLLHSNIFHPKTGEYESDTSRFDSPAKKDESGQTHQEKYILPKIRFSNLAFYPKYLLGTQSQDSFEDFSKEYLESPKYGYGITDVTFSDREGQGDDGEGNPLTVSLAGKEYGLTVRLGTEATTCKPITRQVAYAGNTLTHYNLFGDLVYKNSDDKTTGIPTPTRGSGGYTQTQIASLFENLITKPIKFSGTKTFENAVQFNNTIAVNGAASLNNTLTVAQSTTLNGETTINNTFTVGNYKTTLGGNLQVDGDATFNGAVNLGDNLDIQGNLSVAGTTKLADTLEVTGKTTLNDALSVAEAVSLNKTLSVSEGTTLIGGLTVGDATHKSNTNLLGALSVSGTTTLNDALTVATGKKTTLGGDLQVSGATALNGNTTIGDASTDTLTINAKTTFNNNKVTFNKGLTVPYTVDIVEGTSNSNGSATFSGSVTVNNNMTVSGGGVLAVDGDTKLADLFVSGNTTLGDNATEDTLTAKLKTAIFDIGDKVSFVNGEKQIIISPDTGDITATTFTGTLNGTASNVANALTLSYDGITKDLTFDGSSAVTFAVPKLIFDKTTINNCKSGLAKLSYQEIVADDKTLRCLVIG